MVSWISIGRPLETRNGDWLFQVSVWTLAAKSQARTSVDNFPIRKVIIGFQNVATAVRWRPRPICKISFAQVHYCISERNNDMGKTQ